MSWFMTFDPVLQDMWPEREVAIAQLAAAMGLPVDAVKEQLSDVPDTLVGYAAHNCGQTARYWILKGKCARPSDEGRTIFLESGKIHHEVFKAFLEIANRDDPVGYFDGLEGYVDPIGLFLARGVVGRPADETGQVEQNGGDVLLVDAPVLGGHGAVARRGDAQGLVEGAEQVGIGDGHGGVAGGEGQLLDLAPIGADGIGGGIAGTDECEKDIAPKPNGCNCLSFAARVDWLSGLVRHLKTPFFGLVRGGKPSC